MTTSKVEQKIILIVEDEFHAADRLQKLLQKLTASCEIIGPIDTVKESVEWLENNPSPDIILMDIQLADGISFSIFDKTLVESPVIFTTAYDEYSLKAFKVNSIDYLMKPIDEKELENALLKYSKLSLNKSTNEAHTLNSVLTNIRNKEHFKERFLLKNREEFTVLSAKDIAYFYSENSTTFIVDFSGQRCIYDQTLNQLEENLNPKDFFRINRKQIVHVDSIESIHSYFNNRVKLNLKPKSKTEVIVSREKVKSFKDWLNQ